MAPVPPPPPAIPPPGAAPGGQGSLPKHPLGNHPEKETDLTSLAQAATPKNTQTEMRLNVSFSVANGATDASVPMYLKSFLNTVKTAFPDGCELLSWDESNEANPISNVNDLPTGSNLPIYFANGHTKGSRILGRIRLRVIQPPNDSRGSFYAANMHLQKNGWQKRGHRIHLTTLSSIKTEQVGFLANFHPTLRRDDALKWLVSKCKEYNVPGSAELISRHVWNGDLADRISAPGQVIHVTEEPDKWREAICAVLLSEDVPLQYRYLEFGTLYEKSGFPEDMLRAMMVKTNQHVNSMTVKTITGLAPYMQRSLTPRVDDDDDEAEDSITLHDFILTRKTASQSPLFVGAERNTRNDRTLLIFPATEGRTVRTFLTNLPQLLRTEFSNADDIASSFESISHFAPSDTSCVSTKSYSDALKQHYSTADESQSSRRDRRASRKKRAPTVEISWDDVDSEVSAMSSPKKAKQPKRATGTAPTSQLTVSQASSSGSVDIDQMFKTWSIQIKDNMAVSLREKTTAIEDENRKLGLRLGTIEETGTKNAEAITNVKDTVLPNIRGDITTLQQQIKALTDKMPEMLKTACRESQNEQAEEVKKLATAAAERALLGDTEMSDPTQQFKRGFDELNGSAQRGQSADGIVGMN